MRKLSMVVASLLGALTLLAQNRTFSGVVADTSGLAVPYAVVELFAGEDTTALFQYAVTDTLGVFSIPNVPTGRHCIRVSHMDYETFVAIASEPDTLFVIPASNTISAAVATADYAKFSANKIIVDMEGNPVAQGKTTASMLRFLPGVRMRENDYSVFGKKATIYLDGRKLRTLDELSNILAENISSVEIIPIAGSKYDSTNDGSIIRITTKKVRGTQGNVTAGAGVRDSGFSGWNTSAYVSHRASKLSLNGNLYAGQFYGENTYDKDALYKDSGEETFSRSRVDYSGTHLQAYASAVYDFKPDHSLGLSFRAWGCPNTEDRSDVSDVSGSNDGLIGSGFDSNADRYHGQWQASLNYSLGLDDRGSNLSVIADWLRDVNDYDMPYSTVSRYSTGEVQEENYTHESRTAEDMVEVDADVEQIFKNGDELDYGAAGRIILANDRYDGEGYRYKGRNLAGYVQYSKEVGDFSLQAGVRYEHDWIWYKEEAGTSVSRKYDRLFPSLVLGYSIDDDKDRSVELSYEKRGGEMPYWYISPEKTWTGEYSYETGNLSVRPSDTHHLSLTYLHNSDLNFTVTYSHEKDALVMLTRTDETEPRVHYVTYDNEGEYHRFYFDVEYSPYVTKWWRTDIVLSLSANRVVCPEEKYSSCFASLWCDNDFRFGKWGGQANFSVETPRRISNEEKWNGTYHTSVSAYRNFLENKLRVNLTIGNPVGMARTVMTETSDYYLRSDETTKIWIVSLSLTYRFSSGSSRDFRQATSIQSATQASYSVQR